MIFSEESDLGSPEDSIEMEDELNKEKEQTADHNDSESDLNYSDIYPLEGLIPDFDDTTDPDKFNDFLYVIFVNVNG